MTSALLETAARTTICSGTTVAAPSPASICARCGRTIWRACSMAKSSRCSRRRWCPGSRAWSRPWGSSLTAGAHRAGHRGASREPRFLRHGPRSRRGQTRPPAVWRHATGARFSTSSAALHFARGSAQPLEFRRMGDNGVTEGWAMTFDHLMMLPTFLRRVAGISGSRAVSAVRRIPRASGVAPVLREARLRAVASSRGARARAQIRVRRAAICSDTRAGAGTAWIEDVDPHYYCIRYIRAWMFAGPSTPTPRTVRRRLVPEPAQRPLLRELVGRSGGPRREPRAEAPENRPLGLHHLEMIDERV